MAAEAVYEFLKRQNRPYSLIDIGVNLDKEKHGKAAIQKSLDKLVDQKKVFVKVNGKQKVYCITQTTKENLSELKTRERECQERCNEQLKKLQELDSEIKEQEATLKSLTCGMTLEEAEKECNQMKENNEKLSRKLDKLMETSRTGEDIGKVKKKAEKSLHIYSSEYSKRKRMCTDILDCILESYPGSKKQLLTEIGIDLV